MISIVWSCTHRGTQLSSKMCWGGVGYQCFCPHLGAILIQKIFVLLCERSFTLTILSQLVHLTVCVNQLTTYHSVVLNSLLYRTIAIVTNIIDFSHTQTFANKTIYFSFSTAFSSPSHRWKKKEQRLGPPNTTGLNHNQQAVSLQRHYRIQTSTPPQLFKQ